MTGEKNSLSSEAILSVIIPALNEEDGIQNIMNRVLAVRPALLEAGLADLELIVVDDGSKDQTPKIVSECTGVKLVRHPHNRGYGAALKTGFDAARGDLLAFLDADGTYPPEYFPQLCMQALSGADLVVGSRRSGASSEMPAVRRLGNLIWATLLSVIAGQKVMDPASGMRVFRRSALERLYPLPNGLNFTPVMSTRAVHEGLRFVEVAIPYKERLGRSKLNVIRDGMRFLQTILWTALNYNPVRLLGGVGLMFTSLAFLIALVLVGMRISGVKSLGPWGVAGAFTAVGLAMAGFDLFALGVTFNYLVTLFHKRPVRQGLFGHPIFKTPLEHHFWWLGLLSAAVGTVLGFASFGLALGGWPIERLWLYLLAGTMLILIGLQLVLFWIIIQVLDELSQREALVQDDMRAATLNL